MKKYVLIIIIALVLIVLYARYIGTSGIIVHEYKIINSNITDEYHGLKIVHISDIHYGSTIKEKELGNLIGKINQLNPDIVVLTGDLIDSRNTYEAEIIINYLSKITAKLGKYAISGNHDLPIETFDEIIEKSNFINLNNAYDLIYDNSNLPIVISGIDSNIVNTDSLNNKTQNFNDYLSNVDIKPLFSILLMHEADFIDELNLENYNLVLAGHSHGRQVNIPWISNYFLPPGTKKYYKKHYNIENTDMFISNGLGTSKLKLRLFSKPSINLYRITKE